MFQLNYNFEEFLTSVYKKFPEETLMILGSADASPESGNAKAHTESYAFHLFPDLKLDDTREFDRATLGLKAFFDIITQTNLNNWPLNATIIEDISDWIIPQIKTQEDLDGWSYAILFNDLGKLHISNDQHIKIFGELTADHDINMVDILKSTPEFYPNFLKLDIRYQDSLISGLNTAFNLGKAAQLECPSGSWSEFLKLNDFDKNFHLGHSFFDFIGISGAKNPKEYSSALVNNETISAFNDTIEYSNHYDYGMSRLRKVGLSDTMDNAFPIARLISMSRIFTEDNANKLMQALSIVSTETKDELFKELNNPGSIDNPAIELQYLPAVLHHAINEDNALVLAKTLISTSYLFSRARLDLHENLEIQTLNLIELATHIKQNSTQTFDHILNCGLDKVNGGWKLTFTELNKDNVIKKLQERKLSSIQNNSNNSLKS